MEILLNLAIIPIPKKMGTSLSKSAGYFFIKLNFFRKT